MALAGFMARRGCDQAAWLIVCALFGPVGAFFVVELAWAVPRPAEVISVVAPGEGTSTSSSSAWPTATCARVVTFDGPREVERQSAEHLRADASALRHADTELVLLFGTHADAMNRYLGHRNVDVVVAIGGPTGRVPAPRASQVDRFIARRLSPSRAMRRRLPPVAVRSEPGDRRSRGAVPT